MSISKRYKTLLLFGDAAVVATAIWFISWARGNQHAYEIYGLVVGGALTTLTTVIGLYIFDAYNPERSGTTRSLLGRCCAAATASAFLSGFVFYTLPHVSYGRGTLILTIPLTCAGALGWRRLVGSLLSVQAVKPDAIIVGVTDYANALQALTTRPGSPYRIVGVVESNPIIVRSEEPTWSVVHAFDEQRGSMRVLRRATTQWMPASRSAVAVADSPVTATEPYPAADLFTIANALGAKAAIVMTRTVPENVLRSILKARFNGLTILDGTDLFETLSGRVPIPYVATEWLLFAEGFYLLSQQQVQHAKRVADLLVAAILIVATAPLWLAAAAAIAFDSGRPVFFKQERIGRGNRSFTLWKFRSMQRD